MSWFSEIAGKAEDLLNRVDKSAAGALHKSKTHNISQEESETIQFLQQEALLKSRPTSTTYSNSAKTSTSSSVAASPSHLNKANKKDEDEKLLEFLNSPDTTKPSRRLPVAKKENVGEWHPTEVASASTGTSDSKDVASFVLIPDKAILEHSEMQQNVDSNEERTSTHEPMEELPDSSEETLCQEMITSNNTEISIKLNQVQCNDQLEIENKLLHNEVLFLTQEVSDLNQRCKDSEGEIKRLQKKSEHWNSQISTSDHLIRDLQEKESDLKSALDAKNSQLAVLRVRIQETDQELMVHRTLVETLRNENEKILTNHNDYNESHHKTVESLQEKLQENEIALRLEKEARNLSEVESFQRLSKLEEEQKSLTETLTDFQKKYMDEKALSKDMAAQMKNLKVALELSKQDLTEYRQKAQRILQSKEKLINTLKETREDGEEISNTMEIVELEDLRQERDALKEEVQKTSAASAIMKSEMQEAENKNQCDLDALHQQISTIRQQLHQAQQRNEEMEVESNHQKEELRYVREDLTKTKMNLQVRIKDRDAELEKLRKQVMAKQVTSSSQSELESRIRTLTENLIQKQTLVEALSTEKNSLVMQLERMEQKVKDINILNSRSPTHVDIAVSDEGVKNRLPVLMTESPYDNTVTRRVKRAYSLVDAFSIRLGVFLRHYPVARIFVILYMILLHLWVMVVLLTYQPEVHTAQKLQNRAGPK